jgi:NADH-quinone oxidoreductase subunit N
MDWSLLLPGYLVSGLAFGVFAADLIWPNLDRRTLAWLGSIALGVIGVVVWFNHPGSLETFGGGVLIFDDFSKLFFVVFIGLGAMTVLGSARYVMRSESPGEFYALLILSVVGAMGMAAAGELITAYISLELLSFSLYVLASHSWRDRRTNESGTKYILLGAVASAFLLFGISYLYGLTGTTHYGQLAETLGGLDMNPGLIVALTLVTAGLGFKIAAVPFHMWTPDVYEGAPIPVTAYLASASKAAGFALLLRLTVTALGPVIVFWDWAFLLLAVSSMVLGNTVAIMQSNIKRLMAYSSIGQVGYLLMGVAALGAAQATVPAAGVIVHTIGYAASTLLTFFVIQAVYSATGKEEVADYAGLAERSPFLAMALTAGLFSLAGFPFFVGFATKFYLFAAVATAGPRFLFTVSLAILASLISLYYYLGIIRRMYMESSDEKESTTGDSRLHVAWSDRVLITGLLVLVVAGGVYIFPIAAAAKAAAVSLFATSG